VLIGNDASATCTGNQPIEGQNWLITQHTNCWNDEISVNDIEVQEGSFTLTNVTLTATGKIILEQQTNWIRSTVIHNTTTNSNLIDINSVVTIKGTNLTINAPEHVYGGSGFQGMKLSAGSKLIITDMDDNPNTNHDVSNISSMNWNVSDPYNTALEFWGWGDDQTVELSNSVFHHLFAVTTNGDNVIVKNNSFYYCGTMAYATGDNLIFENNYAYNNSYGTNYGAWFVDYYGNNGTIRNNFIEEGDGGAIFIDSGYNYLIENNTFLNMTSYNIDDFGQFSAWNVENARWFNNTLTNVDGYGFWLNNVTNSVVAYNSFKNVSEGIIAGGENFTINNNIFDECGWTYYAGAAGGCIAFGGGSIPVDITNVTIFNNHITGVEQAGIMLYTGEAMVNHISVYDNYVQGGYAGILLTTYGSYTLRPENLTIENNTFQNNNIGINIYKSYTAKGGSNNIITNNNIYNTSIGINLDGTPNTYPGMVVSNNYIDSNDTGIYVADINEPTIINNTIISLFGLEFKDTGTIKVENNIVTVGEKAIIVADATGIVTKNQFTGNCNHDNCDKIFFVKVSKIGAEITDRSEITFTNNNITFFKTHIRIFNSEPVINSNILDYGAVGLLIEQVENRTFSHNLITNNSYSIQILDSNEITIQMNNLSNFDVGIYSVNSSSNILTNYYEQGVICLEFIDSSYVVNNYDNFDCTSAFIFERYNIKVQIVTDDGSPSPNHQFYYQNYVNIEKIYSNTMDNGFSKYLLLTTLKVDNSGLNINFNNYSFGYYHNDILNLIDIELNRNQTIVAYLDVIAPTTFLYCDSPLIKTKQIPINLNIVDGQSDFMSYDIYYLKNDGENFAEWTLLGTFNESIVYFDGQDSTKYRFKSISRDIYGNVETKTGYDYEVNVDTTKPDSYFEELTEDYYFSSQNEIYLSWSSSHSDVSEYSITVEYTNFTNAFLNPTTVVWTENASYNFNEKSSIIFNMNDMGHYGFKIIAKDNAGNIEVKESYDFMVNYDPSSDTLSLLEIPSKWGDENLTITYQTNDLNLEFDIFIALESVDKPAHSLAWYYYSHESEEGTISLTGLQDSMRYYLVIKSLDLAGNIENPLDTTRIYSGNDTFDQFIDLEYIPLTKIDNNFIVKIDQDSDGVYEYQLKQGNNESRLQDDEFFLDVDNKRVIFGGIKSGGFVPVLGENNIQIIYSGVHEVFEVYTAAPPIARDLAITHTNTSNVVISFVVEENLALCKVQRTTDKSKGWFNENIIEPCESGAHEYIEDNLDSDKTYYYRIWTEDEFKHSSISGEKTIVMEEVVKFYETNEKTSTSQFGMEGILPIMLGVGIILLSAGGFLLYKSKNQEIDDNIQLIESKPIAKYKIEQLYLIYQDGRLLEYVGTGEAQTDTDIMSGMLTAINDFVQDSFQSTGDLGAIDYGDNTVILQRGTNCYLAAVVYGEVDKYLRSKLANLVRSFEGQNPNLKDWNGDVEQILGGKLSLEPLIQETIAANREMVDNYLSEKEIVVNTIVERQTNLIKLKINISNYSSEVIENCSLCPIFNSAMLAISNIKPDISYSFSENAFFIGDLGTFNEISFDLELIIRAGNPTDMELDLIHTHKGRELRSNNKIGLT